MAHVDYNGEADFSLMGEAYVHGIWVPFDPLNGYFAYLPQNYLELYKRDHSELKSIKIYMSTDTKQAATEIIKSYRYRYQQEFVFRDGKQFSGLENEQARDWLKINFHVNCALTVVNLAKAAHHLNVPVDRRGAFSMSDITTAYANERLALRIFRKCGIDPNLSKMKAVLAEVRNYAARAA